MYKALSITSIILSIAALNISLLVYFGSPIAGPSQEEINKMITAELDARERARIAVIAPKAKVIYRDLLSPEEFNPDTFVPTTYEELFAPFISIITGLTTEP